MKLLERIKDKTRQQYRQDFDFYLLKLSGAIQQNPLKYFIIGLCLGIVCTVFSRLAIGILFLAFCVCLTLYLIAPEGQE